MKTTPPEPTPPVAALEAAIAHMKGPVALARELGVPQSSPSMWRTRGRVPAEHCPSIERVTRGAVRCEDLRPDVEWAVVRASPAAAPTPAPGAA